MKKFSADKNQLGEALEIELAGKTYTIEKISSTTLEEVAKIQETDKGFSAVAKQLALILGIEASELEGIDIRKIAGVLKFITTEIAAGIESTSKNA